MSATYKTDAQNPPSGLGGVSYWERSGDPFHADAFKGLEVNNENTLIVVNTEESKLATGERKQGWMAIDWCENPVGFVPDGTEVTETTRTKWIVHTNGPTMHDRPIAELEAVDFFTARWWPRYYYVLEAFDYDFDTLRRAAHDKDTLYVVMGQDVFAKLHKDLQRVLSLEHDALGQPSQFAGKPLFVEPPADVRGSRRGMELDGKFAIGRKRRTRRVAGGNLSEFLDENGVDKR